ncbi:hypothetical protein LO763_28615, partial [Glycomyces sp. A-F 0318]|uniref:hypothetical protein n=1 Tax=Glycomyces amatae TaxID=2881355 RepID=UPI001E36FB24
NQHHKLIEQTTTPFVEQKPDNGEFFNSLSPVSSSRTKTLTHTIQISNNTPATPTSPSLTTYRYDQAPRRMVSEPQQGAAPSPARGDDAKDGFFNVQSTHH